MIDQWSLGVRQRKYVSIKKEGLFELCYRQSYYCKLKSKPGYHFINKKTNEDLGTVHELMVYPYDENYNFLPVPIFESLDDILEVPDDN